MKKLNWLSLALITGCFCLFSSAITHAATADGNQISFDSLNSIYYLSRDKNNLSLLTTEETILADFPANPGFYGITRTIPKSYQGKSVNVKILNINDATGNSIPFKTSPDKDGNLVVITGDPKITLYGFQTYKLRYQTSGVINLDKKNDEFLLNVNGRGWDRPINQVSATVHIPSSFKAKLLGNPICYLGLNESQSNACQIQTQKNKDETVVISKAVSLLPHQGLVLKLDFAHSTFTNNRSKP